MKGFYASRERSLPLKSYLRVAFYNLRTHFVSKRVHTLRNGSRQQSPGGKWQLGIPRF